LDTLGSPPRPVDAALQGISRCVFCREQIHERNARSGVAERVIAALAYGSLGTATVTVISLNHFAGIALTQARQSRADRSASSAVAGGGGQLPHLEAARITSTAETVKALCVGAAPIAAVPVAVWVACNRILL
jgi:hypothetical protein